MKRLLATAIACGALWFHPPAAHAAADLVDLTWGTPTLTNETNPSHTTAPSISINGLGSGNYNGGSVSALSVPVGGSGTTPRIFFAVNPGSCTQGQCSNEEEIATVNLTLTGDVKIGATTTNLNTLPTITGLFTATFNSTREACANGDPNSPSHGDTDCLIWAGSSPNAYGGSVSVLDQIGNTGFALQITLYNATDWTVYPSISLDVVPFAVPAPEPASIALLGFGLLGTAALARRRRV